MANDDQTACEACPAGKFSPVDGASSCLWCYDGEFVNNTNATSCQPCPPGTQWRDWRKGVEGAGTTCDLCDPGTFADAQNASLCTRCAVGRFQNLSGALGCDACDEGMVAPAEGSVACRTCELGNTSKADATACLPCDVAGYAALPHHAHYIAAGSCDSACDGVLVSMSVPDAGSDEQLCGMALDLLTLQLGGQLGRFVVLAAPVLLGALLVFVLAIAPPVRRCVARRRAAAAERRRRRAVAAAEAAEAGEGAAEGGGAAAAEGDRVAPLLGAVPGGGSAAALTQMSSLSHALEWEKHKYRAKQHVTRLYLTGTNSATQPWRLPPLPRELRPLVSEHQYFELAELFIKATAWSSMELLAHSVLVVLLPPLSLHFVNHRRYLHWRKAHELVYRSAAEGRLWRSLQTRVWEGHRLELGACSEYALGWIDIFLATAAPLVHQPVPKPPRMSLERITTRGRRSTTGSAAAAAAPSPLLTSSEGASAAVSPLISPLGSAPKEFGVPATSSPLVVPARKTPPPQLMMRAASPPADAADAATAAAGRRRRRRRRHRRRRRPSCLSSSQ